MREINLEETKKIEVEILTFIDKFCRENDIEYFMSYGTLLGAVRHKGFIPWDDDIDICMKREDYDKFINLTKKLDGNYKVLSLDAKEDDYFYSFVKVVDARTTAIEACIKPLKNLGVWVDIFPLDNYKKNFITDLRLKFLNTALYLSVRNKHKKSRGGKITGPIKTFIAKLFRVFNPIKTGKKIEKIGLKFNKKDADYYFTSGGDFKTSIMKKELYDGVVELEFENKKFFAPKRYDEVLTCYYGDYMTPPPEEKRVAEHFYKCYYKD